ncbi:MAG: hypothetical protein U0269_19605 [Polyangiales bacterium]
MKKRIEIALGLLVVGLAVGVAHCNNSSNNTTGQGSSGNEQVAPVEDSGVAEQPDAQPAAAEPVDSGVEPVDSGVAVDTGVVVDSGVAVDSGVVDSGARRRRR